MANPVIACASGGIGRLYYELQLDAATPAWRQLKDFFPPPTEETMLNKSESLVIETKTENGKPTTHVATSGSPATRPPQWTSRLHL